MDFKLLEAELRYFFDAVGGGDFYDRFQVPENMRIIKDIAISGNGEPTSLADFAGAVDLIGKIATAAGVLPGSRYVLITNGSLLHQARVQDGLLQLCRYGGEVWYKLDSATAAGRRLLNNAGQSVRSNLDNLLRSASLCQTKIQTCLVDVDRQGFPERERLALLSALREIRSQSAVHQVMLYTIARPSLQPESVRLSKMPLPIMQAFAEEIRMLGFDVSVSF